MLAMQHTADTLLEEAAELFKVTETMQPGLVVDTIRSYGWQLKTAKGASNILMKGDFVFKHDQEADWNERELYSTFVTEVMEDEKKGESYENFPRFYEHRRGLTLLEMLQPRRVELNEEATRFEKLLEHNDSKPLTEAELAYIEAFPIVAKHRELIQRVKAKRGLNRISVKNVDIMQRLKGPLVVVDIDIASTG